LAENVIPKDVADCVLLDELESKEQTDCTEVQIPTLRIGRPVDGANFVPECNIKEPKEERITSSEWDSHNLRIAHAYDTDDMDKRPNGQ
jgi:hypothetical protein